MSVKATSAIVLPNLSLYFYVHYQSLSPGLSIAKSDVSSVTRSCPVLSCVFNWLFIIVIIRIHLSLALMLMMHWAASH